ncbi:hypothetical protein V8E53_010881 [Lactarius tabidus]
MTMDDDMYPAPRQRLRLRITTPENRASARVLRRRGVPVAMSFNEGSGPPMPGVEPLGPVQKKVRNLNEKASEKLRATEELKEKEARGERLEATQQARWRFGRSSGR